MYKTNGGSDRDIRSTGPAASADILAYLGFGALAETNGDEREAGAQEKERGRLGNRCRRTGAVDAKGFELEARPTWAPYDSDGGVGDDSFYIDVAVSVAGCMSAGDAWLGDLELFPER